MKADGALHGKLALLMARFATLGLVIAALVLGAGSRAARSQSETARILDEVVVFGHATDERITEQVREALGNDGLFYSQHVSVTTRNGVVTLDGIVEDTGELSRLLRLTRRIPGVKRVFSGNVWINDQPADGG